MTNKTYKTNDLAKLIGVHVNTIRFYEEMNFITKPKRLANNYRQYSDLQLLQCQLVKKAMRAEVLQNGLRKQAIKIVMTCANNENQDFTLKENHKYQDMINNEINNARNAIKYVESILDKNKLLNQECKDSVNKTYKEYKRKEVLEMFNITLDTLRTWERNDLIRCLKKDNGHLVYTEENIQMINIVRSLRLANYSIQSIHRLQNNLNSNINIENVLNTISAEEEEISICSVCDRLIVSLEKTYEDTKEMEKIINQIITLQ